jgi:hypothetical protein
MLIREASAFAFEKLLGLYFILMMSKGTEQLAAQAKISLQKLKINIS